MNLEDKYKELVDVMTDIAVDYNINEGSEGIPITPGHKRCIDMANAILEKQKINGFVFRKKETK